MWFDPYNLRAPSFMLDDALENQEWVTIDQRVRGVMRTLNNALVTLHGALGPLQVRGLSHP
jgi:hypothetical protein